MSSCVAGVGLDRTAQIEVECQSPSCEVLFGTDLSTVAPMAWS